MHVYNTDILFKCHTHIRSFTSVRVQIRKCKETQTWLGKAPTSDWILLYSSLSKMGEIIWQLSWISLSNHLLVDSNGKSILGQVFTFAFPMTHMHVGFFVNFKQLPCNFQMFPFCRQIIIIIQNWLLNRISGIFTEKKAISIEFFMEEKIHFLMSFSSFVFVSAHHDN